METRTIAYQVKVYFFLSWARYFFVVLRNIYPFIERDEIIFGRGAGDYQKEYKRKVPKKVRVWLLKLGATPAWDAQ